MQTGIKSVDTLITKYGILVSPGADEFQRRVRLTGGDERANNLPFCMYQKVAHAPLSKCFNVHHFYLPSHKGKLASFLFDEKGNLIEQVYYQRVARWVKVCRKLELLVKRSKQDIQLAA